MGLVLHLVVLLAVSAVAKSCDYELATGQTMAMGKIVKVEGISPKECKDSLFENFLVIDYEYDRDQSLCTLKEQILTDYKRTLNNADVDDCKEECTDEDDCFGFNYFNDWEICELLMMEEEENYYTYYHDASTYNMDSYKKEC